MYHGLADTKPDSPNYELYLILENAQLKIIHVFMQDGSNETFYIGQALCSIVFMNTMIHTTHYYGRCAGLNGNKWHRFKLMIDSSTAKLIFSVDSTQYVKDIPSLREHPNYGVLANSSYSSRIYFGGKFDTQVYTFMDHGLHHLDGFWEKNDTTLLYIYRSKWVDSGKLQQQYNYVRFVGCLGNIQFGAGGRTQLDVPLVSRGGVEVGCQDRCSDFHRCLHGGSCLNHYTHSSCDCFGTGFEGDICSRSNLTTVTMRGYSYFSYRLFYWKDRIHSDSNRIGIFFKTYVADSVLLYGAGLHPVHNYIALSIKDGILYFKMEFGNGSSINATLGSHLHDHAWHNLTVDHRGKKVEVALDRRHRVLLEAPGQNYHLHLDPEVYIGAAPPNAEAVQTHKKFVGCLKSVYFNQANLLWGGTEAGLMYHSVFPIEWGCSTVGRIPLTFSTVQSRLELQLPRHLQLVLEFKTELRECVLASGRISTPPGYWEVGTHTRLVFIRFSQKFVNICENFQIPILFAVMYNVFV
ncbi:axo [Cordylochernes scorpioides]|uniref:Axo n=1 Tax=Cordylochernes scorpioides TaxID=51811 RepID=A0ABY6L7B4_9ARAC|nr:axo [Cordylochernes scorpioides]